jgi:hypothetical protein
MLGLAPAAPKAAPAAKQLYRYTSGRLGGSLTTKLQPDVVPISPRDFRVPIITRPGGAYGGVGELFPPGITYAFASMPAKHPNKED